MLHLRFEGWSIEFPEEWEHEIDNHILALSEPGADGRIEIAALSAARGGDATDEELFATLEEFGADMAAADRLVLGAFDGLTADALDEDGDAMRYWVLRAGDLMLLATHRTAADRAAAARPAVERILASLKRERGE